VTYLLPMITTNLEHCISPADLCKLAGHSVRAKKENHLSYLPKEDQFTVDSGYSCIFNWLNMNYTFMSDSVKNTLGYDKTVFMNNGFRFALEIIHPDDRDRLKEMHRLIFEFFYHTPVHVRSRLRFSYNFRVRTADGSYLQIMRQSIFNGLTNEGKPIYEYINSTDISSFWNNNNMRLIIHRLSSAGTYTKCYEYEIQEQQYNLSQRELQVLELARKGHTSKEIASRLYLSIDTIKSHRRNILAKTGACNIIEAISIALNN